MAIGSSSSGSEEQHISDTIPSDYPSESHSEIDVETRSLPVSSASSFENKAYIHDTSSFCSESYVQTQEKSILATTPTPTIVPRLPVTVLEQPKFDVQLRVKDSLITPASLTSDSESSTSRFDRNLSIILEQREESVRSITPPPTEQAQFTHIPELHQVPKHIQLAPTYNRILRRQHEMQWEDVPKITSIQYYAKEAIEESKHAPPTLPPPPPIIPKQSADTTNVDFPKSEITSHLVDDVYLKTITEKRIIEDVEKRRRLTTEYHTRPKLHEHKQWDITIKNYPVTVPDPPEWENFSDISSASGLSLASKSEKLIYVPTHNFIKDNILPLNSPELVCNIGSTQTVNSTEKREKYLNIDIPRQNIDVPNWDVLIRVLEPSEEDLSLKENSQSQLTFSDMIKWRQIITTHSNLRTLLSEAVDREDFERIRNDKRFEKIFEPIKWDIILRILTPLDKTKAQGRFKKKGDWDTRSRRSSLPTLYEYDSDNSNTIKIEAVNIPVKGRRNSRSSYKSETDLRSLSEMTVDFGKQHHGDNHSEISSYIHSTGKYYEENYQGLSLTRSISQPSLARSSSEFTERWIAPSRYDTASEFTSPEGTPKLERRIEPYRVSGRLNDTSSIWNSYGQLYQNHTTESSDFTSQIISLTQQNN